MNRSDRLKIKLERPHHVPNEPHSEPQNDGARNNKRDAAGSIEIRVTLKRLCQDTLYTKRMLLKSLDPNRTPITFALPRVCCELLSLCRTGGD
jgi:hypothetical protein